MGHLVTKGGGGTTETSCNPDPPAIISSGQDITRCHKLPTINPDNLVGYKFVREFDGTSQRAVVKEHLDGEEKFLVEFVNGGEELMAYNDLVNAYNAREEEGIDLWTYDKILDHRKSKKGQWQVKILWDTGDETWEPMKVIREDDKLTLAKYARQ